MHSLESRGPCRSRKSSRANRGISGIRRGPFIGAGILLCSLVAAGMAADLQPSDWPQWRGPARTGALPENQWPDQLNAETLQRVWRNPLGPGYSGPIVVGARVFVTETEGKKTEVVRALNLEDGKPLWRVEWQGALSVPFFAKENGDWIRATPACDGERLYVAGMRDVLVCLAVEDGKELWRFDFVQEFKTPLPAFGFVCSPLVDGPFVYVQAGAAVVKLEKQTGKQVWRSLSDGGGMWGSAFSSPVLASLAGKTQLVVQTRNVLAGLDPETGTVLWQQEIPAFRGMNILTPTVWNGAVFTSSYGGKSLLFDITSEQGQPKAMERWNNKTQAYMSSPVVVGEHAYLHLRNQRLTCLHLPTGETRWTTQPFGKYWSMATSGDKILALDQRGELRLIRANSKEFELLGSQQVSEEETWGHLAVAGNYVLVRELGAIAAFRWKN